MIYRYAKIKNQKKQPFAGNIYNYLTVGGYTKMSGAPTDTMVQLEGSNRWYRVMQICRSNSGTLFVKTKDNPFMIVQSWHLS